MNKKILTILIIILIAIGIGFLMYNVLDNINGDNIKNDSEKVNLTVKIPVIDIWYTNQYNKIVVSEENLIFIYNRWINFKNN
jgi:hypothetical protein